MNNINISCYGVLGISVPNFMFTFCFFGHPRDSIQTWHSMWSFFTVRRCHPTNQDGWSSLVGRPWPTNSVPSRSYPPHWKATYTRSKIMSKSNSKHVWCVKKLILCLIRFSTFTLGYFSPYSTTLDKSHICSLQNEHIPNYWRNKVWERVTEIGYKKNMTKQERTKSAIEPSERAWRLTNQLRFVGCLGNLKFKLLSMFKTCSLSLCVYMHV